jgi:hypothetical protein
MNNSIKRTNQKAPATTFEISQFQTTGGQAGEKKRQNQGRSLSL